MSYARWDDKLSLDDRCAGRSVALIHMKKMDGLSDEQANQILDRLDAGERNISLDQSTWTKDTLWE